MSTVPVTDALQRLEAEGIVESKSRVGTRVRIPTQRSIRGHFLVREALEVQAARLVAERATPQERAELSAMALSLDDLDRQHYDGHGGSVLKLEAHRFHLGFHQKIAECCGYVELREAIHKVHTLIFYWFYDISSQERYRPPSQWHAPLIEAVTGTDPDEAEGAMRRHIRYGMDFVLESLEPQFANGRWRLQPRD